MPAASSSPTWAAASTATCCGSTWARADRAGEGLPAGGRVPAGRVAGGGSHGLCEHGVSRRRRALVRAGGSGQHGVDGGRFPRPSYNPAQAATLLDGLELRDRDNDGLREDAAGRPVRFAVLVQSGITAAQTAMSFVRDALANVGVGVDIVALDLGTVMTNLQRGKYDAVFHYIQVSDTDPASNLDFWLSRGPAICGIPGRRRRPRRGRRRSIGGCC